MSVECRKSILSRTPVRARAWKDLEGAWMCVGQCVCGGGHYIEGDLQGGGRGADFRPLLKWPRLCLEPAAPRVRQEGSQLHSGASDSSSLLPRVGGTARGLLLCSKRSQSQDRRGLAGRPSPALLPWPQHGGAGIPTAPPSQWHRRQELPAGPPARDLGETHPAPGPPLH